MICNESEQCTGEASRYYRQINKCYERRRDNQMHCSKNEERVGETEHLAVESHLKDSAT